MNGPVEVPNLDSLASDPSKVQDLPVATVQHILIQLTALLPLLVSRSQSAPEKSQEDRLLTIEQAASILGMSKDRLYRTDYPFTIRDGGLLRFSHNGIQRFIRARLRQG